MYPRRRLSYRPQVRCDPLPQIQLMWKVLEEELKGARMQATLWSGWGHVDNHPVGLLSLPSLGLQVG